MDWIRSSNGKRSTYRILVVKVLGKKTLSTLRQIWEDNTKNYLRNMDGERMMLAMLNL